MNPFLPPNATNFEKALACAVQIPALATPLRELWSPDDCPAAQLPWLAWQLGVDNWSPTWSEEVKREKIRQAIAQKRIRGTRASIDNAISGLGASATLTEWFETDPPGPPYTFDIVYTAGTGDETDFDPEFVASVVTEVRRTKPLRAHFTFTEALNAAGSVGVAGVARAMVFRRLIFDAA